MADYLTAEQTAEMLGITRRTFLSRYAVRPDFPNRIRISQRVMFWEKSEVAEWMKRYRERRQKA